MGRDERPGLHARLLCGLGMERQGGYGGKVGGCTYLNDKGAFKSQFVVAGYSEAEEVVYRESL